MNGFIQLGEHILGLSLWLLMLTEVFALFCHKALLFVHPQVMCLLLHSCTPWQHLHLKRAFCVDLKSKQLWGIMHQHVVGQWMNGLKSWWIDRIGLWDIVVFHRATFNKCHGLWTYETHCFCECGGKNEHVCVRPFRLGSSVFAVYFSFLRKRNSYSTSPNSHSLVCYTNTTTVHTR